MTKAQATQGYARIVGPHRYVLSRSWRKPEEPLVWVLWVMLNPSTANATEDDATIRRVTAFSKALGANQFVVVNLFAWRSKDPKELITMARLGVDIVGEHNDTYLQIYLDRKPARVVCGWGTKIPHVPGGIARAEAVLQQLRNAGATPETLKRTEEGYPGHPLYLPESSQLVPYG